MKRSLLGHEVKGQVHTKPVLDLETVVLHFEDCIVDFVICILSTRFLLSATLV